MKTWKHKKWKHENMTMLAFDSLDPSCSPLLTTTSAVQVFRFNNLLLLSLSLVLLLLMDLLFLILHFLFLIFLQFFLKFLTGGRQGKLSPPPLLLLLFLLILALQQRFRRLFHHLPCGCKWLVLEAFYHKYNYHLSIFNKANFCIVFFFGTAASLIWHQSWTKM